MCNDPKDIAVDLSKLMQSHSQPPVQTPMPTIPANSIEAMLTSCNEEVDLVGNDHSTYNGGTDEAKDD